MLLLKYTKSSNNILSDSCTWCVSRNYDEKTNPLIIVYIQYIKGIYVLTYWIFSLLAKLMWYSERRLIRSPNVDVAVINQWISWKFVFKFLYLEAMFADIFFYLTINVNYNNILWKKWNRLFQNTWIWTQVIYGFRFIFSELLVNFFMQIFIPLT